MLGQERGVSFLDVLLVLLLFLWPPMTVWLWAVWRRVREARAEMRRFKADAEADAAEGFPPPGPPTTDHPSPK